MRTPYCSLVRVRCEIFIVINIQILDNEKYGRYKTRVISTDQKLILININVARDTLRFLSQVNYS